MNLRSCPLRKSIKLKSINQLSIHHPSLHQQKQSEWHSKSFTARQDLSLRAFQTLDVLSPFVINNPRQSYHCSAAPSGGGLSAWTHWWMPHGRRCRKREHLLFGPLQTCSADLFSSFEPSLSSGAWFVARVSAYVSCFVDRSTLCISFIRSLSGWRCMRTSCLQRTQNGSVGAPALASRYD